MINFIKKTFSAIYYYFFYIIYFIIHIFSLFFSKFIFTRKIKNSTFKK